MLHLPDLCPTDELRRLLHYTSNAGVIDFCRRSGLTPVRRGRCFLWSRDDVVRILEASQAASPQRLLHRF